MPIAWAIAKGTLPIIGATKVHHVEDAAESINIQLSESEIGAMEKLTDKANINTIRFWEKNEIMLFIHITPSPFCEIFIFKIFLPYFVIIISR